MEGSLSLLAGPLPPEAPPRLSRHPRPRLTRQTRCYTLEQAPPAADPNRGDARPAGRCRHTGGRHPGASCGRTLATVPVAGTGLINRLAHLRGFPPRQSRAAGGLWPVPSFFVVAFDTPVQR